ncbi:hypothetical protein HPP92_024183 [Vanilla planifolia]|uniref:Uncharacterized protein n=1 Tax=Vanilla planifolia TaxID=51239 RepID=A0A835PLX5_VANPL|nr:hypothetical protein HPP92_024183 [Vanilla planifolia]
MSDVAADDGYPAVFRRQPRAYNDGRIQNLRRIYKKRVSKILTDAGGILKPSDVLVTWTSGSGKTTLLLALAEENLMKTSKLNSLFIKTLPSFLCNSTSSQPCLGREEGSREERWIPRPRVYASPIARTLAIALSPLFPNGSHRLSPDPESEVSGNRNSYMSPASRTSPSLSTSCGVSRLQPYMREKKWVGRTRRCWEKLDGQEGELTMWKKTAMDCMSQVSRFVPCVVADVHTLFVNFYGDAFASRSSQVVIKDLGKISLSSYVGRFQMPTKERCGRLLQETIFNHGGYGPTGSPMTYGLNAVAIKNF